MMYDVDWTGLIRIFIQIHQDQTKTEQENKKKNEQTKEKNTDMATSPEVRVVVETL